MKSIYTGIVLYAASFGLFATGHLGGGLLCVVLGTVVIMKAHGGAIKPGDPDYEPQRVAEVIDMKTGEVLSDWRAVMAEVSTHVTKTGCMVTRADFTDPSGTCPYGGKYSDHPAG